MGGPQAHVNSEPGRECNGDVTTIVLGTKSTRLSPDRQARTKGLVVAVEFELRGNLHLHWLPVAGGRLKFPLLHRY